MSFSRQSWCVLFIAVLPTLTTNGTTNCLEYADSGLQLSGLDSMVFGVHCSKNVYIRLSADNISSSPAQDYVIVIPNGVNGANYSIG